MYLNTQPFTVPGLTIFEQDWWLDAAAPGAWQKVDVHWDKVLVGSLSFVIRKRLGLRFVTQPPLTRILSPHLCPPASSATQLLMNRVKILEALLQKLPAYERFEFWLKPGCETVLPFVMLNYPVAHTYTFLATRHGAHGGQMHQKTRNVVTKAEREFEVVVSKDIGRFLRVLHVQHAHDLQIDVGTVQRLYIAAHARGQAAILCAVGQDSVDVASAILVWDSRCLYFWLSARDPARSSNAALSLLVMRAIEMAEGLGLTFDADGFVSKESGIFFAKFGLAPAVRPYVSHGGPIYKLLRLAASWGKERKDRYYKF